MRGVVGGGGWWWWGVVVGWCNRATGINWLEFILGVIEDMGLSVCCAATIFICSLYFTMREQKCHWKREW